MISTTTTCFHDNHILFQQRQIALLLKLANGRLNLACMRITITTIYCLNNNKQPQAQLLLYSSNLLTVATMEMKLGTYTYYTVSMTTTYCLNNNKYIQAFTSSLLKFANGSTHRDETWYAMYMILFLVTMTTANCMNNSLRHFSLNYFFIPQIC